MATWYYPDMETGLILEVTRVVDVADHVLVVDVGPGPYREVRRSSYFHSRHDAVAFLIRETELLIRTEEAEILDHQVKITGLRSIIEQFQTPRR